MKLSVILESVSLAGSVSHTFKQNYGNIHVLIKGYLYNRNHLLEQFNLAPTSTDAQIIVHGYEQKGKMILKDLDGDFAIIIIDQKYSKVHIARDHIGVVPLYFSNIEKSILISTHPALIIQNIAKHLNQEFLVKGILWNRQHVNATCLNDVEMFSPGTIYSLKDKEFSIQKYWDFNNVYEAEGISEQDAIRGFKQLLCEAVKKRIPEKGLVGVELSGGLDSSTVTGFLKQHMLYRSEDIVPFSHCLPLHEKPIITKDERKDIGIITDYLNIDGSFFMDPRGKGILESIRHSLKQYGMPFYLNFPFLNDILFEKLQEEKVHFLFSGFGGDQLISNRGEEYFSDLIAQGKIRYFLKEFYLSQTKRKSKKIFGLFRLYLSIQFSFLHKLRFFKKRKPFEKDILRIASGKLKKDIQDIKKKTNQKNTNRSLREISVNRLSNSFTYHRLELSHFIAEAYNVTYRYPLLDKNLLEYYHSLPYKLKHKNGWGRYMIRKAIEEIVPPEIQWKNDKHGATVPGVYLRILNDEEKIRLFLKSIKEKGSQDHWFKMDEVLAWFEEIIDYFKHPEKDKKRATSGAFIRVLTLLIYLEEFHDGPQ